MGSAFTPSVMERNDQYLMLLLLTLILANFANSSHNNCKLQKSFKRISRDCTSEPECSEKCSTVNQKICKTQDKLQCSQQREQKCRTVTEEVCETQNEQVCSETQEETCETVEEEVCSTVN